MNRRLMALTSHHRLYPICGFDDSIARVPEHNTDEAPDEFIVINNED